MARLALLNAVAIPAAGTYTTTPVTGLADVGDLTLYANFDWTSGGTSIDAYIQTTFDGTNWIDIANFHFTGVDAAKVLSVSAAGDLSTNPTLTDGALAADTVLSGLLGDQLRVKYVVVGTYAGSTLSITAETRTDAGGSSSVAISGTAAVSQAAATLPAATVMQNGVSANANGTSLSVAGYATAMLQIVSSPAMSGGTTVNFEASADGGTTWVPIVAHLLGTVASQAITTTADGDYRINCASLTHIRARISGYSAGTVTVRGYVSPLAGAGTAVAVSNLVQPAALGPALAASSLPVVLPSTVEVTGLSAGSLNADLVPSTDVSAYRMFALQVTGTWSGTFTVQGSNDNSNFVAVAVVDASAQASAPVSTLTSNKIIYGSVTFRYLRVRMTSYSSGTANGVLELSAQSVPFQAIGGSFTFQSTPSVSLVGLSSSNGVSITKINSAATTNATSVKASAGRVYKLIAANTTASAKFVKLYNKASAPTVGTDVPSHTFPIAANGMLDVGWGVGAYFTTGIALAITGAVSDTDSTAVAAGDVLLTIEWI